MEGEGPTLSLIDMFCYVNKILCYGRDKLALLSMISISAQGKQVDPTERAQSIFDRLDKSKPLSDKMEV